jgi:hypothetical protein
LMDFDRLQEIKMEQDGKQFIHAGDRIRRPCVPGCRHRPAAQHPRGRGCRSRRLIAPQRWRGANDNIPMRNSLKTREFVLEVSKRVIIRYRRTSRFADWSLDGSTKGDRPASSVSASQIACERRETSPRPLARATAGYRASICRLRIARVRKMHRQDRRQGLKRMRLRSQLFPR